MTKRILDIGNCTADFWTMQSFLTGHFDCEVIQAHRASDALAELKGSRYDLVLVNRTIDRDGSDGIELIRELKADAETAAVPVMLVTNFPEYQDAAEDAGAVCGFGKSEIGQPEAVGRLQAILGE